MDLLSQRAYEALIFIISWLPPLHVVAWIILTPFLLAFFLTLILLFAYSISTPLPPSYVPPPDACSRIYPMKAQALLDQSSPLSALFKKALQWLVWGHEGPTCPSWALMTRECPRGPRRQDGFRRGEGKEKRFCGWLWCSACAWHAMRCILAFLVFLSFICLFICISHLTVGADYHHHYHQIILYSPMKSTNHNLLGLVQYSSKEPMGRNLCSSEWIKEEIMMNEWWYIWDHMPFCLWKMTCPLFFNGYIQWEYLLWFKSFSTLVFFDSIL